MIRVGIGYDAHRFESSRKLVLGGVTISNENGLLGYSDADVLVHALIDAFLGAAGMGDIGAHFPDSDDKWKDAESIELLKIVYKKLKSGGWDVNNIDCTIVAQSPRLAPFIPSMKKIISDALAITPDCVNIKAKTTEGMGFVGRREGIEAYAVVSIARTLLQEGGT